MGLGKDCEMCAMIDKEVRRRTIEQQAESGWWTTKDGRKIHVRNMESEHIQNTIRLLERNNEKDIYMPWINRFKRELERRLF